MTYFADYEPPVRHQRVGRGWVGWAIIIVVIIAVIVTALIPSPYVIERPGPVFDTLGNVESNGENVPLIDIPMQTTYATTGSLDLLTVNVDGDNEHPENWFAVGLAWLDPSKAIVPITDIYPTGVTVEQTNKENALEMQNSQKEAVAAALSELHYSFDSTVSVADIRKGTPADGTLKAKDVIETFNGEPVKTVTDLRAKIKANGIDKAATIKILRDDKEQSLDLTPVMSTDSPSVPILGIIVSADYTFPFEVNIQLQDVGGPSAGQMFALGIIDKLTKGYLNGGQAVAGTGTITADGTVGAIGGIRQKMWGAVRAGAKYFLAPESNCKEVVGHVPDGLTVIPTSDLKQSLIILSMIAKGDSVDSFARCTAS